MPIFFFFLHNDLALSSINRDCGYTEHVTSHGEIERGRKESTCCSSAKSKLNQKTANAISFEQMGERTTADGDQSATLRRGVLVGSVLTDGFRVD